MTKKILFVTSVLLGSSTLLAGCGLLDSFKGNPDSTNQNSVEINQTQPASPSEPTANDLPTLENELNELKLEPETFE
jgi:hypothetical protein